VRVILIFSVILIVIVFVAIRFRGGKKRFPWYEFYSRGRKEGFSFKEIKFLKQIAVQNKLEKPQSIFWSTRQLDRCLKPAIQKINASEDMEPAERAAIIHKLLQLRKKAELNLPKYQKRIRDTTTLLPRQRLSIREQTYGSFVSWVVEINRKYLVVTMPSGQKGWQSLNWSGKKVEVYFWRQDDAGYTFESKVVEHIIHEEYPLIYLTHSSSLKRIQKRKSIRVETNFPARFNPVSYSKVGGVNKAFVSKRVYAARIIDMSETGCCMLAGKMLKKNDRLKIDFHITKDKRILALGLIVSVSKTGDERVRRYHIMFLKISPVSTNNILLFVYNIFGERADQISPRKRTTSIPPRNKEKVTQKNE
jgi:c-di-GMP-binding flagellar brake protein YcgR